MTKKSVNPVFLEIRRMEAEDFVFRWIKKAEGYTTEDLESVFDRYTSFFVAYNRLYSEITLIQFTDGSIDEMIADEKVDFDKSDISKINKPDESYIKDNKAATICIAYCLKESLDKIIEDNKGEIQKLRDVLPEFNIVLSNDGSSLKNQDAELIANLDSNDPFIKVNAILVVLYKMRCNIFHGHKGLQEHQKKLLQPASNILRYIINSLLENAFK